MWCALLSGRATMVEEFTADGRVYLVVQQRDPTDERTSTLTEREAEVATRHARGASSKCVGFELGIRPPTVSAHLSRALRKLGLACLSELVRLYAWLVRPAKDLRVTRITHPRQWIVSQPAPEDRSELTSAERSVARLVAAGLSNAEIAALRRRSERTVANQVASLLHKLGIPSRHQVGWLAGTGTIPRGRNLRPGSAASTLDSLGAFPWSAGVTTIRTAT